MHIKYKTFLITRILPTSDIIIYREISKRQGRSYRRFASDRNEFFKIGQGSDLIGADLMYGRHNEFGELLSIFCVKEKHIEQSQITNPFY